MDFSKINNQKRILNDARNFTSYQPGTEIDNYIKTTFNITNNRQYREFLIKNSDNIIKNNQNLVCNQTSNCNYKSQQFSNIQNNNPYIFNELTNDVIPNTFSNSDLKQNYLSREKLNSEKYSPSIYINL
jgi:hypothetical protein